MAVTRPSHLWQTLLGIVLLFLLLLGLSGPSLAGTCTRTSSQAGSHQICILKIERSAKKYWEYWAVVQVDGVTQPKTVYDCRARVSIRPDQTRAPFTDAGPLVCRLYKGSSV
jgi:hypothetical protein